MAPLLSSLGESVIYNDPVGVQLNLRRQACILARTPLDHSFDAVLVEDKHFDIDKTIFADIREPIVRQAIRRTIGVKLHWLEQSSQLIARRYLSDVIRPIPDKQIMEFLRNDCDMKMEMCDDSFEDHLVFCHDFCAANFSRHSPRVMLLHGVLGENTNHFPMSMEKYPRLAEMLSPEELTHVEAFPSVSRLLLNYTLLEALRQRMDDMEVLKRVVFHRVVDNEVISLDAEQLWVHLNYHLIHFMDFVPSTAWHTNVSQENFRLFLNLYKFLKDVDRLYVSIAEISCGVGPEGKKFTLQDMADVSQESWRSPATCKVVEDSVRRYSELIGHCLQFDLQFFSKDEITLMTESTPSQPPSTPLVDVENLADLRFFPDDIFADKENFHSLQIQREPFSYLLNPEQDSDDDADAFDQDLPEAMQSLHSCVVVVDDDGFGSPSLGIGWPSVQIDDMSSKFSDARNLRSRELQHGLAKWHDEELGNVGRKHSL